MQALILAGGKGTRLRPLTVYTPKPIVPLVNRPFLLYQLEILARAGIKDIVLSLSYQPDKIEDVLGDGSDFGVNLRFVTEPNPMGTAGAYKYVADTIRETTIVCNGDILTDADISKIIAVHHKTRSDATIALVPVDDPSSYGVVETTENDSVVRFIEKPNASQLEELNINTVNAGIYILEPTILDLIPKNENSSFEYTIFPLILEKQKTFNACILRDSYWLDIGNPASYLQAHHDFLSGRISGFDIDRTDSFEIAASAIADKHSVVGEGCVVKPNARIINSVLGAGVHVEDKAIIENSVIWSHTRVSSFAEIRDAVIGRSCHIGKNVSVGKGAVLGDKTSLPDYSRV